MYATRLLPLVLLAACSTTGSEATPLANLDSQERTSLAQSLLTAEDFCDGECDPHRIEQDRSLIVTDREILQRFPLRRVLRKLVNDVGASTSADDLWSQWWASQRERTPGDPTNHPFCDDNGGTINGFPIICPRNESLLERERMETHTPTALVNRFDLAPLDGSNCGEYRIVYALDGQAVEAHVPDHPDVQSGRNFIIFEGVLPNPDPECGLAACVEVAEFWQNLTTVSDIDERGELLEKFYFEGICDYEPVVHASHYGLKCEGGGYGDGCGQIRTNQFIDRPWNLREFNLQMDGSELLMQQVTVKSNPHTKMFDGTTASFNTDYANEIDSLLPNPDNINTIGLKTSPKFDAGESLASAGGGFPANDYLTAPLSGLQTTTDNALTIKYGGLFPIAPLTLSELDERATTQSCGGCHEISNSANLGQAVSGGTDLIWPNSLGFVHIDEFSNLSPALDDPGMFLDHRERVLFEFLDTMCGEECLDERRSVLVRDLHPAVLQSDMPAVSLRVVSPAVANDAKRAGGATAVGTLSGRSTH